MRILQAHHVWTLCLRFAAWFGFTGNAKYRAASVMWMALCLLLGFLLSRGIIWVLLTWTR